MDKKITVPSHVAAAANLLPERQKTSGISVLVVGAGPCGVFTALECWQKGHDVRIIERNAEARTQGDFFTFAPQAIRQIQKWPGMVEENEKIAVDPWVSMYRLNGEKMAGPESLLSGHKKAAATGGADHSEDSDSTMPKRMYRHSRPKLLSMFISQLRRVGVEIEYGLRAVDYHEDAEKAGVTTQYGKTIEADVVIAADGIATKSHGIVTGSDIRAVSSGLAGFRGVFPVSVLKDYPELDERSRILDNGHEHMEMFMGRGLQMLVLRTNEVVSWGMMHKDTGTAEDGWSRVVSKADIFRVVSEADEFPEYCKNMIEATPEGIVIDWKLMWRNPQPKTTSPLGRVVQVGDAAHTFLPASGNGINQGIEDAAYVATCLELGGRENVGMATKVHNKLRYERVSCCQLVGFINYARRERAGKEKDPSKVKSEHGQWTWGHNPEQYVYDNYEPARKHLEEGTAFENTNIPPGHTTQPWTVDELMAKIEEGKPIELDGDWS